LSNHSLRAIVATRLFNVDIDEQLIKIKTCYAVRAYKRVAESKLEMLLRVSLEKLESLWWRVLLFHIKLRCLSRLVVLSDCLYTIYFGDIAGDGVMCTFVSCEYLIRCPKLFLVSVKRILLESFITSDSCDAVI